MSENDFVSNIEEEYEQLSAEEYRERVRKLFCMWNARQLVASYGHYLAASQCDGRERRLSIVNISAAILVLFLAANTKLLDLIASAFSFPEANAPVIVSVFSVFVVLSSASQYILQYASRSALHKQAGNEFSNLRRKIERYWSRGNIHPEAVHSLNRSYNMISKAPPLVPPKLWDQAKRDKRPEIDEINKFFFCQQLETKNSTATRRRASRKKQT